MKLLHQHQFTADMVDLAVQDGSFIRRNGEAQIRWVGNLDYGCDLAIRKAEKG